MKYSMLLLFLFLIASCWKDWGRYKTEPLPKVWGYKPVYAALTDAQHIVYDPHRHPVTAAGNIYAFKEFIFQVDVGRGIHVINNTIPSQADRIGFITVNGCAPGTMPNGTGTPPSSRTASARTVALLS